MEEFKARRLSFTGRAEALVKAMSLEEKIFLMSGRSGIDDLIQGDSPEMTHYNFYPLPASGNERLGIPPVLFCDGTRGLVCGTGKSTCFPVTICRGASFDRNLERDIGKAIGREIRAAGGNLFGGVCVNLPYHPGWGRSQESYGEESFAIGQMGAALVEGVQSEQVMACVKHFAFNSMEISRFKVSIDCSRRAEREVFLPHFKDCIDAGAACVMSAYNRYKGIHCGHHDYLLRKVLKEEWDFDGFVMSDFAWGVKDTVDGANNGLDMEMCGSIYFGPRLVKAVRDALVPERRIDEAALRIVRTVTAFEEAWRASGKHYGLETIGCAEHCALALRSARESITLLQNRQGTLPFKQQRVKKLALIGALGSADNTGDHGSSRVYPAHIKTPLEGLIKMVPDIEIVYYGGNSLAHVRLLAREADAVVIITGLDHRDEGEYVSEEQAQGYISSQREDGSLGGDRKNGLGLHKGDIALIEAAGLENRNSVVVLMGGGALLLDGWKNCVSAILLAYYPGQEGGTALAEILFGEVNPSGKLPFVIPVNEGDLLPQSERSLNWDTKNQYYDYYHGYTKLEKEEIAAMFPFGFGLSYTQFAISEPAFSVDAGQVTASCWVKNIGEQAGDEVIQLYVGFKQSQIDRPVKLLRGFTRVSLEAGTGERVCLSCPLEKLKFYNPKTGEFELESMSYEVYIGSSSAERDLLKGSISL